MQRYFNICQDMPLHSKSVQSSWLCYTLFDFRQLCHLKIKSYFNYFWNQVRRPTQNNQDRLTKSNWSNFD